MGKWAKKKECKKRSSSSAADETTSPVMTLDGTIHMKDEDTHHSNHEVERVEERVLPREGYGVLKGVPKVLHSISRFLLSTSACVRRRLHPKITIESRDRRSTAGLLRHPQLSAVVCRYLHHLDVLDMRLLSQQIGHLTDEYIVDATIEYLTKEEITSTSGKGAKLVDVTRHSLLLLPLRLHKVSAAWQERMVPVLARGWAEVEQLTIPSQFADLKNLQGDLDRLRQQSRRTAQSVVWLRLCWMLSNALNSASETIEVPRWGQKEIIDALECSRRAVVLDPTPARGWYLLAHYLKHGPTKSIRLRDGRYTSDSCVATALGARMDSYETWFAFLDWMGPKMSSAKYNSISYTRVGICIKAVECYSSPATWLTLADEMVAKKHKQVDVSGRAYTAGDCVRMALKLQPRDAATWLTIAGILAIEGSETTQLDIGDDGQDLDALDCVDKALQFDHRLSRTHALRTVEAQDGFGLHVFWLG